MKRKLLIIITIIITRISLCINTVLATNNTARIVEMKEKTDMSAPNILLVIIAIVEIAIIGLITSKNKDNKKKGNLILLIIFGILSVISVITGIIIYGIIANTNNPTIYDGMKYFAIRFFPITVIPFVLSIVMLPITRKGTK